MSYKCIYYRSRRKYGRKREVIASRGKARYNLALDIKHAMRNSNSGNDNVIDGPSFIDAKIQGFSGVYSKKTIENARVGTKTASGAKTTKKEWGSKYIIAVAVL